MAYQITETNFRATDGYVAPTSRYANSDVIYYGPNNYITFKTYVRTEVPPQASDKVAQIPPGMQYRPDLVSQSTYGTPDFWWRIMEVNNIWDIFDFKAGLTIRLPSNIFA